MDYFELLEMNTESADIQFQLYQACLNGEGGGTKEAQEWLERAAQNGHPEALALLNAKQIKNNEEPEDDYSSCSILDLLEKSHDSYTAAKALYSRVDNDLQLDEKINLLYSICSFEEASVDDFEELAYLKCVDLSEKGNSKNAIEETVIACENAIELGSIRAMRCLVNAYYGIGNSVSSVYQLGDKLARKGEYSDKVALYLIINSKEFSTLPSLLKTAWFEEITQSEEQTKYQTVMDFVKNGYSDSIVKNLINNINNRTLEKKEYQLAVLVVCALCTKTDIKKIKLEDSLMDVDFQFSNFCKRMIAQQYKTAESEVFDGSNNAASMDVNNTPLQVQPYTTCMTSTNYENLNKKRPISKTKRILLAIIASIIALSCLNLGGRYLVNRNKLNLADYIVSENLFLEGYQNHGEISTEAEDLINWDGLYANKNNDISIEDFKTKFECSYDGKTENLNNGDIVYLTVKWNKNEVDSLLNKKMRQKGEYSHKIVIKGLSDKPVFNLFKYVDVDFEGTENRVKVNVSAKKTNKEKYGFKIEDALSENHNVACFNIYYGNNHIETYEIGLDRNALHTYEFNENDIYFYHIAEGQNIQLICEAKTNKQEVSCIETELVVVQGLEKPITDTKMITNSEASKFINLSKTSMSKHSYLNYDGLYLISSPTEGHYNNALVAVYRYRYYYHYYNGFVVIYDPSLDEDGHISSFSQSNIVVVDYCLNSDAKDGKYDIEKALASEFKCTKIEKINN